MIGVAVRHGRTKSEAQNLASHLLKETSVPVELINSGASDLHDIMSDMLVARDGSRADAAFLHFFISPARDMSDNELRQAADIALRHFGAEDHQAAFMIHEKNRASGKGNRHAHVVVGRVGPDGKVLQAGFEKIKMETATRIAEYELGEPVVLGRHHTSCLKWLRANGRNDVADYMEAAHGSKPKQPKSLASPGARHKIERLGLNLTDVTSAVQASWDHSDNGHSFVTALYEKGFDVAPGEKAGVYVVLKDGAVLGSLDRLLKKRRREVSDRMMETNNMKGKNHESESTAKTSDTSNHGAGKSDIRSSHRASPTAGPVERARASGRRADRSASSITGIGFSRPASSPDDDGRSTKGRQRIKAQQTLTSLDQSRLKNSTVFAAQSLRTHRLLVTRHQINDAVRKIEAHKSGWSWIEEFRNDLLEKIRDIRQRLFGVNTQPAPKIVSSPPHQRDVKKSDVWNEVSDDVEYQPLRFG